ncbi:NAD(P)-binding protein [Boletus coccyginus]|nr:NAD(P)-binding protein [Boletus coccyginus]
MSGSRVWLITGTSAGIGQASVKEVIAAGERVAAISRKAHSLSGLTAAYPSDKLFVVEYDVGNPAHSAGALFQNVHRHFGRIDVVVNNAGYGLSGVVEATSDEDARYQFEVNFWGAVRISREVTAYPQAAHPMHRYFRDNKTPSGRIINISSVVGFSGNPTLAFYSASKFALEGFSESLHKELQPEWNIKVITIQPGGVRTEWAKGNMADRGLPPAYDSPDSPAKKVRNLYKSGQVVGDAAKLSRALITISREANPPLRLPLGADAQYIVLNKLDEIRKDVERWDQLTLSSVADDADPLFFKKLTTVI